LHLPSAAGLNVLRGAHGDPPARSRKSQATAFAPFPTALPGSLREVGAFQAGLGRGTVRAGKRATEQRLRQALSEGGIVHLATHGVLNSRNPMFSRVDLIAGRGNPRDDGRLEVHELLALRTDASLVFLSGCETGVGAAWSTQFERGEDYATLAQAFLFSGVGNVVGTLWPIQDDGAAVFAGLFYAALGSQPPAEALATAQRQLLKDGRFGSPYHWAAYQVFGSNDLELPPHIAAGLSVSPN
jgi:CHAT domain-containing protein